MKNIFKSFIAAAAICGSLSLLPAHAAVSVYAEETETATDSNAVATTDAAAETNSAAPPTHRAHRRVSADTDQPPVRIDETGVHVGGRNPVDIDTPGSLRPHEGKLSTVLITAVLGILGSFGLPMVIIAIVFYSRHRRNKMAHETLLAMIDKGVPITPELVAQVRGQDCGGFGVRRTRNRLLPGLILAGVGAALLISGSGAEKRGGWVLVFMGAAFLIVWLTERKDSNNTQPPR